MADLRGFRHLARSLLGGGDRGHDPIRRIWMQKLETFAFALSFIAVGMLTLVAQVAIV
jgi:hypothetical protein